MKLPTIPELNEITALLAGPRVEFEDLDPPNRAIVLDLAIKADQSEIADFAADRLEEIAHWFRLSKLWDGL